jgi:hypothetical protein
VKTSTYLIITKDAYLVTLYRDEASLWVLFWRIEVYFSIINTGTRLEIQSLERLEMSIYSTICVLRNVKCRASVGMPRRSSNSIKIPSPENLFPVVEVISFANLHILSLWDFISAPSNYLANSFIFESEENDISSFSQL